MNKLRMPLLTDCGGRGVPHNRSDANRSGVVGLAPSSGAWVIGATIHPNINLMCECDP